MKYCGGCICLDQNFNLGSLVVEQSHRPDEKGVPQNHHMTCEKENRTVLCMHGRVKELRSTVHSESSTLGICELVSAWSQTEELFYCLFDVKSLQ
jgi:hypothetical protein